MSEYSMPGSRVAQLPGRSGGRVRQARIEGSRGNRRLGED